MTLVGCPILALAPGDSMEEQAKALQRRVEETLGYQFLSEPGMHRFRCPLSGDLMLDPIRAQDGRTYEGSSIRQYIDELRSADLPLASPIMPPSGKKEAMGDALESDTALLQELINHLEKMLHQHGAEEPGATPPPRVKSIDELSAAFSQLDPLRELLHTSLDGWTPPMIVVVGEEKSGKSTLLERLAMMPLFPRDERICTKLQIHVRLRRCSPGESKATLRVVSVANGVMGPTLKEPRTIPMSAGAVDVRAEMDALVREEHGEMAAQSSQHFCTDRGIVLEVQSPIVPTIDLVDMPGLNGSDLETANRMLEDYRRQYGDRSLFLLVVPASNKPNANIALNFIVKNNLQGNTCGVFTHCDELVPRRHEWFCGLLMQPPTSLGAVEMEPYGWVATMNADADDGHGLSNFERLERQAAAEVSFFEEGTDALQRLVPSGKATTGALISQLGTMYSRFLADNWAPLSLRQILEKLASVKFESAMLGRPFISESLDKIARDEARNRLRTQLPPYQERYLTQVVMPFVETAKNVVETFVASVNQRQPLLTAVEFCSTFSEEAAPVLSSLEKAITAVVEQACGFWRNAFREILHAQMTYSETRRKYVLMFEENDPDRRGAPDTLVFEKEGAAPQIFRLMSNKQINGRPVWYCQETTPGFTFPAMQSPAPAMPHFGHPQDQRARGGVSIARSVWFCIDGSASKGAWVLSTQLPKEDAISLLTLNSNATLKQSTELCVFEDRASPDLISRLEWRTLSGDGKECKARFSLPDDESPIKKIFTSFSYFSDRTFSSKKEAAQAAIKAPPFQLTQYPGFIRKVVQSLDRKLPPATLDAQLRRFLQNFSDLETSQVFSISVTASHSGARINVDTMPGLFSSKVPLALLRQAPCIADLLVLDGIGVGEEVEACATKRASLATEASQLIQAHDGICAALSLTPGDVAKTTAMTEGEIRELLSPIGAGELEDFVAPPPNTESPTLAPATNSHPLGAADDGKHSSLADQPLPPFGGFSFGGQPEFVAPPADTKSPTPAPATNSPPSAAADDGKLFSLGDKPTPRFGGFSFGGQSKLVAPPRDTKSPTPAPATKSQPPAAADDGKLFSLGYQCGFSAVGQPPATGGFSFVGAQPPVSCALKPQWSQSAAASSTPTFNFDSGRRAKGRGGVSSTKY